MIYLDTQKQRNRREINDRYHKYYDVTISEILELDEKCQIVNGIIIGVFMYRYSSIYNTYQSAMSLSLFRLKNPTLYCFRPFEISVSFTLNPKSNTNF